VTLLRYVAELTLKIYEARNQHPIPRLHRRRRDYETSKHNCFGSAAGRWFYGSGHWRLWSLERACYWFRRHRLSQRPYATRQRAHVLNAAHTGSCVYTCPNGVQCVPNTQCIATVYSYNAATGEDTGTVTGSAHVLKFASASSNNTNNGQVTAPASAAENAAVCFNTSCNVSISVTAADRIRVTSIAGREFWMPMWWRPFTLVTTGAFGGGALVYLAVLIFSR